MEQRLDTSPAPAAAGGGRIIAPGVATDAAPARRRDQDRKIVEIKKEIRHEGSDAMIVIFGGGEIADNGIVDVGMPAQIIRRRDCDVRDYRTVERTVQYYEPDVVIYTAAVTHAATVAESDVIDWTEEITVNVVGAYHVARASVLNGVKTMIFIASVAGLHGKPGHSGYSASKAALISLVQSLAMEGHDAYAISPGRVNTRLREREYPGEDPHTRIHPRTIGLIVKEILAGQYAPGDNIIIRMRGFDLLPIEVDKGTG